MTNQRWTPPPELDQSLPRRVKPTGLFKLLIIYLTAMCLLITVVLPLLVYSRADTINMLKMHGVASEGIVTDVHTERIKHGFRYVVDYHFKQTASPDTQQVINQHREYTDAGTFSKLRVGQAAPVLYSPSDPYKSILNVDDKIHREDPFKNMKNILLVSALVLVPFCVLIAMSVYRFQKEKSLIQWGSPVEAKIIAEKEYSGAKGVPCIMVTYEFIDTLGKTVQGKYKDSCERAKKRLTNPVVLYDPKNSSENVLYPPKYAVCYSSSR
jgi:hypothetical protein